MISIQDSSGDFKNNNFGIHKTVCNQTRPFFIYTPYFLNHKSSSQR